MKWEQHEVMQVFSAGLGAEARSDTQSYAQSGHFECGPPMPLPTVS